MKRLVLPLLVVLVFALVLIVHSSLSHPYHGYSGGVFVTIPSGTRGSKVSELLVNNGVIAHRWTFDLLRLLGRPRRQSLKAGEYFFDRPLTPVQVYSKVVKGDVYLVPVVIPEGSDRFDMARIYSEQLGVDPGSFLAATASALPIRDLDPEAPSLEGYLFPDTYRFPRHTTAATAVARMLVRFRQVIAAKFPASVTQSSEKLHQEITLASLVEKETPSAAERPEVAGVFLRRLERDLPLQCDPTVVYAARLDNRPRTPEGGITKQDLTLDSPYNTYRRQGVPPGPICSPGVASIRAAVDPAPGTALYFVSNNHGGHVFASTLEEHNRNVIRYRQELAESRRMLTGDSELDDLPARRHDFAAQLGLVVPPAKAKPTAGSTEQQRHNTSRVKEGTHSRVQHRSSARAHHSQRDTGH
jgi:UPF0755 protein